MSTYYWVRKEGNCRRAEKEARRIQTCSQEQGAEFTQTFAYEKKGKRPVIRRVFHVDTKAVIPEEIDGLPVTEIGAYAFSAHLDEAVFQRSWQREKSGSADLFLGRKVFRYLMQSWKRWYFHFRSCGSDATVFTTATI